MADVAGRGAVHAWLGHGALLVAVCSDCTLERLLRHVVKLTGACKGLCCSHATPRLRHMPASLRCCGGIGMVPCPLLAILAATNPPAGSCS